MERRVAILMFPPALARGVCYYFSADSPCNDGPLPRSQRFTLSVLSKNSEIAGFKFATIGVIYAVILAFAIVSVWEKFDEAELRVLEESGAAHSFSSCEWGRGRHRRDTRRVTALSLQRRR